MVQGTEWAFTAPIEEQNPQDVFNIFPEAPPVPQDPVITGTRAEKYNYAMGDISPGREAIEKALYAGSENSLRLRLVGEEHLRAQRIRQAISEDIVRGKQGEPLNAREQQVIKNLTTKEVDAALDDPQIVMEKLYGSRMIDMANSVSPTTGYQEMAANGGIEKADDMSSASSRIIAGKEVAQKLLEDIEARWKDAGIGATVSNYAEQIVPFFSWWNMQNAIPDTQGNSFLPGNNLEDQLRTYYTLPLPEATAKLKAAIEKMESSNPLDAMNYLRAVIGMTNTDRFIDNIIGVADIASVTPVGTLAKATRATGTMLKDVVKVASKPAVRVSEVLEATGERTMVAQDYFTKALRDVGARGPDNLATWEDMFGRLTLLANPKAYMEGGELAKSAPFLARVAGELTDRSARMIDGILVDPIRIERMVPGTPAFDAAIEEAVHRVSKQSNTLVDDVMWAEPGKFNATVRLNQGPSGVDYVDVMYGRKGGTPFEREIEAQWRIDMLGLKGTEIVPVGNGYGIKVTTPVNYGDPKIRTLLTPTGIDPTPRDKKNMFISWLRTPNEILPKDIVQDRALTTYGISKMVEMAQTMLKDVTRGLSKDDIKGMNEFLSAQRDFVDPFTKQRGKFSSSLGEFEKDWHTRFGRLPSEAEAEAYMKYVQINDMEYAILNLLNHKNKSEMGIVGFKLPLGKTYDDFAASSLLTEGRIVRDDPFLSAEPFNFVIWSPQPSLIPMNSFNSARVTGGVTQMKEYLKEQGLVPVQLTREGEKIIKSDPRYADVWPEGKVDYIYMKSPRAEPLPINQLPYKAGGHVKLKDGFYISQPDIQKSTRASGADIHFYHGDTNFAHFTKESDAQKIASKLDQARIVYKEAKDKGTDLKALTKYLDENLPGMFSTNEFVSLFKKGGPFNINTPFFTRATGSSVGDTQNLSTMYSNLKMGADDVHSVAMQRMDPSYFKERGDIFPSYAWHGSDDAPVIKEVAAELVDPLKTLEASFQNIIRGRYLDDLRVKVTERFINEFGNILDTPMEQLRANPWVHLLDPQFKKGADRADIQAAKNLRRTMLEFLNISTPLEKEINYVKQKLADTIYQSVGKDGYAKLERGREILDNFGLGSTQDGIRFMRSVAFHEKLGLYNPKQLFLQAQNLATILSIDGTRGFKASTAYMFHRSMLMNNSEKVTDSLAKAAKAFGWSKEELMESYNAGYRTGFFRVGGEVAYHDLGVTPSLVQTKFGRALDHGTFFFREGERISRITAWNSAYLRWKALNPGKELNDLEIGRILSRADDLNGNMSRASNAMWQQGVFSIPTQFWGYQARLSELFLGKRLTTAEKARLVTGYSLMYGLPTGFAATGAGLVWPWHEATRKYMLENGMAYDDSVLTRIMTDGIMGVGAGVVYGQPVNFSEQYSPQGLTVVRDLLKGDKGVMEILGGVSSTTIADNFKAAEPFAMALLKVAGYDGGYDLTLRDFTDALSVVSTFSNASRAMHAYYTQEWWSKNEGKISSGNVSAVQAMITGLTGVVPKHVTDAYAMVSSLKDREAMQKEIRTEMVKQLRLGFKSDSVDEANKHFRRAQILFGSGQFTPREYNKILEEASRGYQSLADNISLKYSQTSPERMKDYLRKGQE